jgi:2-keto-4-pentenoate hydratase/2-oxohepta-3-ene-1,7-dioic acid hydratase in catechol pathway
MRFATFTIDGRTSYGIAEAGQVREADAAFRARHGSLRAVLAANETAALAGSVCAPVPLADVTLLPPVPDAEKILCVGQNYLAHIREMGNEPGDYPAIFTRYPSSLRGHGAPLVRPAASVKYDFEGELAVVIGRAGRAIPEAEALDHVAGYACFMDGSIRDFQRHTSQFWPGKNFAATGAMGPWIVTPDEAGAPGDLDLRTLLNGEEVQSSPVSDLACDLPRIIAYLSTVAELVPGDVIATGTPGGVGAARKPPLWLKAGDRIEVEISGIGTLSNPVEDEA